MSGAITATISLILVASTSLGDVSMDNPIDDFTQQKLVQFKRHIDYEKVVAGLGPDRTYIVDWKDILGELIDADGIRWRSESDPDYFVYGHLGSLSVDISNGHESIEVEIRKGGDTLRSTVDSMLKMAASGSAPRVGMRLMNGGCPGDLCLVYGEMNAPYGMYLAKGNILATLKCVDDRTVLPVAKYISEQMDKRNIDPGKSPVNGIKLRLSTDRSNIKLGEEFVFSVEPKSIFADDEWLVDVRRANKNELEYVKDGSGDFTYRSLKRGAIKITVSIMHKRTLQVREETFVVNVN